MSRFSQPAGDSASSPEVSVVIPTHNRWHLLNRALSSVLAQADVKVEVIIVDDASTDETRDRLSELRSPHVRTIRHDEPGGVAHARNHGVQLARGAWVAFLDDDDFWSPRKSRAQLDSLERDGSAKFVWGTGLLVDEEGRMIDVMRTHDGVGSMPALLRRNGVGPLSSVMAATELVRAVGGFNERLRVIADWDMWIRLASRAQGVSCCEPVVAYVQHGSNMFVVEADQMLAEFEVMSAAHSHLAQAHGVRLGDIARARWLALTHERDGRRIRAGLTYLKAGVRGRSARLALRGLGAIGGHRVISDAHRLSRSREPEPEWLKRY